MLEKKIEEKFGKGSIFKLNQDNIEKYNSVDFISTGSKCLNEILSGDSKCGIPKGHITEIYGPEGTGKSTIALHVAAEANKNNIKVAYIDSEHAMNNRYALLIGVNPDFFYLLQPDCGEDAFGMAEDLIGEGIGLIIFDSVDAMLPRAIVDGDMDEQHMGVHARLMGKGLRKLTSKLKKKNIACIFINQIRMKIGGYGDPEVTSGGIALKFYSFVRLKIRAPRSGKIIGKGTLDDFVSDDKFEKGTEIKLETVKNKVFIPHMECRLNIIYGKGIDKEDDLIRYFENHNVLKIESAAFIRYPFNSKVKMKREKFLEKLKDKKFRKEIKEKIE